MKKVFTIILLSISVLGFAQSDPVAVDDTVQVMNQKLIEIYPLLNDYDPDGDTIEIYYLFHSGSFHGEYWQEDSMVYFKSDGFEGWEDIRYRVAEVGNPSAQSENAHIKIEVINNPDVPVANRDTLEAKYLEPTILDVMHNDYDPNGDEIIIDTVFSTNYCQVEISADSTKLIFTSEYSGYGRSSFKYQLREKDTPEKYYSLPCYVRVELRTNEDLPIPVNDTVQATGGYESIYDVLNNDYNPLEDTLEIIEVSVAQHGTITFDEQFIYYRPEVSYTGPDEFEYLIRYKNKPWLYSLEGKVIIDIMKNPECPSGEPDFGSGMAFTEIAVEVLSNDTDPSGDPIEIFDVKEINNGLSQISFSSDSIYYTPPASVHGSDHAYYRIRKTNDPLYYSEWIPVYFEVDHNPDFPLLQPDSATTYGDWGFSMNFAENDIIPDSMEFSNILIFYDHSLGKIMNQTDSTFDYKPHKTSFGRDTLRYRYFNFGHPAVVMGSGEVYVNILNNLSYDSLNINNINAGIDSDLTLFSKHYPGNFNPHFEVPINSNKHTIFLNNLWIAGIKQDDEILAAGNRYNTRDFQAGPVSNIYDSAFLIEWQRTWKITKHEIDKHINNWWKEDYEAPEAIRNWPGNGDPAYGLPDMMAPFFDRDNNGIYESGEGDFPLIRGDQCIFFMANEDRPHDETGGPPMRVEIHCMAYAFDAPDDSLLFNTIFLHYDLINRSENTYYDTYFGTFTDLSIGYEWDDFIGSHVEGNSFFGYNGFNIDGTNDPEFYGEHPPAQSVTIMAGPFIDEDNNDNPVGGCDHSITGLNFGNGVIDDERYGLSYFMYINDGPGVISHPHFDAEYHARLQGYWQLDIPMTFGGFGTPYVNPDATPCRFMFPGNTDPQNWGTECELPDGGYNQNGQWWTEESEWSYPDSRMGMGSSGPFTFYPGDVQEVDMAYVFANSYYDADSSRKLLSDRLVELRQRTLDGEIIIPNSELRVNEVSINKPALRIYPNPAREIIHLMISDIAKSEIRISNALGTTILTSRLYGNHTEIDISVLPAGIYVVNLVTDEGMVSEKFIKY